MTNFALTFLEGVASFLSPCTLPLIPVYVAYFSAEDDAKVSAFAKSVAFVLAFSLVYVVLGAFAGSIGTVLARHRMVVRLVCGGLIVVLGVGYLGLFRLPFTGGRTARPVTGLVSAFLFGLAFALGMTPCVGAFLASALLLAAAEGTALKGSLLLLTYSIGLGVPFIVSAIVISRLKGAFAFVKSHYAILNVVSGVFLIVVGLWLAAGDFIGRSDEEKGKPASATAVIAEQKTELEVTLTSASFENEVLKCDKPVIVDFWAPWCGPCRQLGPIISEIAVERAGMLKVGKVNVDDCPDLATKYGVTSIPAVFLFKNGQVAAKTIGFLPKETLIKQLLRREVDGK